jgi:hypothetical protein
MLSTSACSGPCGDFKLGLHNFSFDKEISKLFGVSRSLADHLGCIMAFSVILALCNLEVLRLDAISQSWKPAKFGWANPISLTVSPGRQALDPSVSSSTRSPLAV